MDSGDVGSFTSNLATNAIPICSPTGDGMARL
jgi:hypothetical protein